MISFTAQKAGREVQLNWQTASEINNKKFVVERSADAVSFYEIGEIAGAGTTALPMQYQFMDRLPQPGKNFYRIKQLDFDGHEQTGVTRLVNFADEPDAALTAYPNPVVNAFSIRQMQP